MNVNQQYPTQPQYGGLPVAQPQKTGNPLLIPFIVVAVTLLAAVGFGVWAFMSRQDYKTNTDKKVAVAVKIAEKRVSTAKDKEFVEKEKSPFKRYQANQLAGSLSFQYPKTWSAFVTENAKNGTVIDGYFHPNYVPGLESSTDFALRVRVVSRSYADEMKQFEAKSRVGTVSISPYKATSSDITITGARVDGEINTGQQDTMILFPLRDKTIEISTESEQFLGDFEETVLASLSFVP